MMFLLLSFFLSFYNLSAQKITIVWTGYNNNKVVNKDTHNVYKELFLGKKGISKHGKNKVDKVILLNGKHSFYDFKNKLSFLKNKDYQESVFQSTQKALHVIFVLNTHGNIGKFGIREGKEKVNYISVIQSLFTRLNTLKQDLERKNIEKTFRVSFFVDACHSGSLIDILKTKEALKYTKGFIVDALSASTTEKTAIGRTDIPVSPFTNTLKEIAKKHSTNFNNLSSNLPLLKNTGKEKFILLSGLNYHELYFKGLDANLTHKSLQKIKLEKEKTVKPLTRNLDIEVAPIYKHIYDLIGYDLAAKQNIFDYSYYYASYTHTYDDISTSNKKLPLLIMSLLKVKKDNLDSYFKNNPDKAIYLARVFNTVFHDLIQDTDIENRQYEIGIYPNILESFKILAMNLLEHINPYKYPELFLNIFINADFDTFTEIIRNKKGKLTNKYAIDIEKKGLLFNRLELFYKNNNKKWGKYSNINFYKFIDGLFIQHPNNRLIKENYKNINLVYKEYMIKLLINLAKISKNPYNPNHFSSKHLLLNIALKNSSIYYLIEDSFKNKISLPVKIDKDFLRTFSKFLFFETMNHVNDPERKNNSKVLFRKINDLINNTDRTKTGKYFSGHLIEEKARNFLDTLFPTYDGIEDKKLDILLKEAYKEGKANYGEHFIKVLLSYKNFDKLEILFNAFVENKDADFGNDMVFDADILKFLIAEALSNNKNKINQYKGETLKKALNTMLFFAKYANKDSFLRNRYYSILEQIISMSTRDREIILFLKTVYSKDNIIMSYKSLKELKSKIGGSLDYNFLMKTSKSLQEWCY